MTKPKSRDDLLELMRSYDLHFEPDSRTEYSNSNYVLLGFIIEDVTGMSYQEALEARITGPLGLEDTYYGMGLMPYVFHDKTGFGHSGGIDGFQSNLAAFPDEDLYIALAANAIAWSNNKVLITLLDAWQGNPVELPDLETVTLPEEHLQSLAGTYASGQIPLEIRIWEEEGNLMVEATGQGSITLDAASETRFRFDPAGLVMEFHADEAGEYRSFTLFQAGMGFLFERK